MKQVVVLVVALLITITVVASSARVSMSAGAPDASKVGVPRAVGDRLTTAVSSLQQSGLHVPTVGDPGEGECNRVLGCAISSR